MSNNPLLMNLGAIVEKALAEDLGDGDHTSLATIPEGNTGTARLIMKGNGILAGLPAAEKVFYTVDPALTLQVFKADGDFVETGEIILTVQGDIRSILAAERTVLNFMQRLSGIATYTYRLVREIEGFPAKILDTRKTTPLMRELEKYAVRMGGGMNHRMGLYDMILIKDNHIDFAGSLVEAVRRARAAGTGLEIEVEARTLDDVRAALDAGVTRILLDNMAPALMRAAVALAAGRARLEASGNVSLENVREIAETGVDYISIGALTHSARVLDVSFDWTA